LSPALKIATLLVLSLSGNVPEDRLRLIIWLRGWQISVPVDLRRGRLIPSKAGLFLLSMFFLNKFDLFRASHPHLKQGSFWEIRYVGDWIPISRGHLISNL